MDHPDNFGTPRPQPIVSLSRLAPVLIVAAALLAYANSLHGPMIFDDIPAIQRNPSIHQFWPLSVPLATIPASAIHSRPIANFSLAINYALGGLDPMGYHIVNLILHVLTALLLFNVVRRTLALPRFGEPLRGSATGIALTVALIWSVHPLATNVVTYIIQRTEGLMALFYLLTLYCVIRGATLPRATPWHVAAVIACALGMGTKEVMVSAPLVVLLYDYSFLSQSLRSAWRQRRLLHIALAATWLVVIAGFFNTDFAVKRGGGDPFSTLQYLRTQSEVIVHYVKLSFWPSPLVLDYLDWPIAHLSLPLVASCVAILATLAATAWALRYRPALGFLGAFFFLILAPTSSFLPLWGEVAAERRMYLPLIPIIVVVVLGCHTAVMAAVTARRLTLPQCRWIASAAIAVLVAILTTATARRNDDYRSALAIWSDTAAKRPGNWRAFTELGTALAADGRPAEAVANYQRAVQLRPDYAMAWANWGVALGMEGKLDDAVTKLEKAIELNPRSAYAHYNLGLAFSKQGRPTLANAQFHEALRVDPSFTQARARLEQAKI
ncbi:MAG TPA: tetratricopeptide repeat protein [Verrucomicrobiae bacterium]|nr:tetratricopeptide repeat protein [Verrucomicrobiae bacterium]